MNRSGQSCNANFLRELVIMVVVVVFLMVVDKHPRHPKKHCLQRSRPTLMEKGAVYTAEPVPFVLTSAVARVVSPHH
jgi:hypothetical protein